ncbi:BA14K family protein [Mesorhizobium sp. BAC0120]|uniref:BA14K family protein n=1 Tax=Mesorhizobium sp. BAC0120 TaxID=3090670 RepID=UPI00399BF77E
MSTRACLFGGISLVLAIAGMSSTAASADTSNRSNRSGCCYGHGMMWDDWDHRREPGYYHGPGMMWRYGRGKPYYHAPGMMWGSDVRRHCAARFRSFDWRTGLYTTYSGQRVLCPYLR